MRKHLLRIRLQQIVQLMVLQYCAILFLVLCGATIYGLGTDNWLAAAEMAEVLAGGVTFFMLMAYLRVRNLVKAYSDNLGSVEAGVFIVDGTGSPVSAENSVVGRVIDMPCM